MVCAMEEQEVAAAIVAGDPTGLAEALDTYAASLFAYCRSILPQAEAADVVEDTFVIARARLDGLRDPARLGQWLQAVARNECFRRIIASGGTPPAEPVTPVPDLVMPDTLAGRIMKVCTDDTPAGRAHRTSVTHRAGEFGHDGFPKPVLVARGRRVPWVAVAAVAVVGAAALATGLILGLSGGSHPSQQAAGLSSPTVVGASSPIDDPAPSPSSASPKPSAKPKVTLAATHSAAPGTAATSSAAVPTANPKPAQSKTPPRTPPSSAPAAAPTTAAPPQPTPSQATSTYVPPPPPALIVSTTGLSLTSVNNAVTSGSFTVLGYGGRVNWSAAVSSGGGHIVVAPLAGTLRPGASAAIIVSASGTVSFVAHITFMPGDHMVTVTVTAKKVVTKAVVAAAYLPAMNVSSSARVGDVAGPSRATANAAPAFARRAAASGSKPAASPARNTPACASPAPVVSTTLTDGAGTRVRSELVAAATMHPSRARRTITPPDVRASN
jgi:hypothetical protein